MVVVGLKVDISPCDVDAVTSGFEKKYIFFSQMQALVNDHAYLVCDFCLNCFMLFT